MAAPIDWLWNCEVEELAIISIVSFHDLAKRASSRPLSRPRSPSSLLYPFIDKQGNAEQSYMIQLIGEAETAKMLADEKALVDELCAYRNTLCLTEKKTLS
jgi:hypothetical protein